MDDRLVLRFQNKMEYTEIAFAISCFRATAVRPRRAMGATSFSRTSSITEAPTQEDSRTRVSGARVWDIIKILEETSGSLFFFVCVCVCAFFFHFNPSPGLALGLHSYTHSVLSLDNFVNR